MFEIDGNMAMAVLPASYQIDFNLLRNLFRGKAIKLATEAEFTKLFPDCEPGAMPPFGNLNGMVVFVAETLAEEREITFADSLLALSIISLCFTRISSASILVFSARSISPLNPVNGGPRIFSRTG